MVAVTEQLEGVTRIGATSRGKMKRRPLKAREEKLQPPATGRVKAIASSGLRV